jgi:hypothetical protein
MFMDAITPAELALIRKYHADRNRAWWNGQSPDERRARRMRYALNAVKKQQAAAERENESKIYETKSKMRGRSK